MRTCTKCLKIKASEYFFVKDKKSGRLHSVCKDCSKVQRARTYKNHYVRYKDSYRLRALKRRTQKRSEYRINILDLLSNSACVICTESDPRVLEFDHINPKEKRFSISQSVRLGFSWEETLVEIAKCQILCANCHKKRTSKQFNWYKEV